MKGKSRPQTLQGNNESCSGMNLGVAGSNPAGRATFFGLIFALPKSDAMNLNLIFSGVEFDVANHIFAGDRTKHCISSRQYCRFLPRDLIGKIGLSYKVIRGRRHLWNDF